MSRATGDTGPIGAGGERFGSSAGLILAALGMAIGTGNIWRFPRVLAANGGGAFLIAYAIFLFTWSIPLLMVEFGLGRRTQRGPVGAFAEAFGPRTSFLGLFVAMCTILIMFYYSVVAGWCLRYLWQAAAQGFGGLTPQGSEDLFIASASGPGAVLFHGLAVAAAAGIVLLGASGGIERACRVMIPALLALLFVAALRALTLPGASGGLRFIFEADLSTLRGPRIWLEALSQSAWSTGAGWGLMLCYAVYAQPRQRAGPSCAATGVGDGFASMLAALAVIPAAFALMPAFAPAGSADAASFVESQLARSGPGLTGVTFVWMPILMGRMLPGGHWGEAFPAALFFLTLAFAALTSLIAMVELGARLLRDLGAPRRRAVAIVAAAAFLCGIPSALSMPILANQDWAWGLGLILSGGFLACGVLRYGVRRFRRDFLAIEGRRGAWFDLVLAVLVPLQAACLLLWWFHQAWRWAAPEGAPFAQRLAAWIDPVGADSVGTCLLQWGALLAVGWLLNRPLAARQRPPLGAMRSPGGH
jgi:NSS family neurotransmitter:Na+ symporter